MRWAWVNIRKVTETIQLKKSNRLVKGGDFCMAHEDHAQPGDWIEFGSSNVTTVRIEENVEVEKPKRSVIVYVGKL